jgi:hypothetical protein
MCVNRQAARKGGFFRDIVDENQMRNIPAVIRTARGILARSPYRTYAIAAALLMFAFYIVVPVLLVPGNTFRIEFDLITPASLLMLVALASMTGMIVALEIFSFRRMRAARLSSVGEGGAGIIASLAGGVMAAASCGCGLGVLLGFFGLGGSALFITEHYPIALSFFLAAVALSLSYSARRAAGICSTTS